MESRRKINNILKKRIVLLDGAAGTQLQKHGLSQGVSTEQWCLENPDVLKAIHTQYCKAGSDIIYTCTFGANRFKLSQYNVKGVERVNKELAGIARIAAGRKVLVAGDIGPTGEFIQPFGNLDFEAAVDCFKEQVRGLRAGGVDLFVIETMIDIQEARAALLAVKEITDKFVMVTMTYEKQGRTLNGTDPLTALITLQSLGADAVGFNCSCGPREMIDFIKVVKPYAKVPLIAKPNAGLPKLFGAKTVFDMAPDEFAVFSKQCVKAGANMLGGCCGTSPEYIQHLKKKVFSLKPLLPLRRSIGALSSARKTLILDKNKSPQVIIIGECINPTGKKLLREEFSQGNFSLLRKMAKEQEAQGALALDVNVGAPGINEKDIMSKVLAGLCGITDLPLVIDSADTAVIASALRFYPGRALINSISGETKKLKKLLPLARKYGAMFIALPLTGKEIPYTFDKRKKIIEKIFKYAGQYGFTKEDIIVDGMVMAVSSYPQAALETLKTIEWVGAVLGCRTVVGLSNISFGLPLRQKLNSAFLAMARAKGVSMAIANPAGLRAMVSKRAIDVLTGKDKSAAKFITYFNEGAGQEKKKAPAREISPEQEVFNTVLEGDRELIKKVVESYLSRERQASKLLYEVMIPAIQKVGELFEKKKYFLPQLMASAQAMQEGVEYLQPYLKDEKSQQEKAVILLATVKGDIHDIGKNIVGLMLKNHGFCVIDLGKDVATESIIEKIKKHKPKAVGLSALMTTTMVNMKEVVSLAREQGIEVKFIVGGAVVTKDYASSIGAEYARDGVEAVKIVKEIL